MNKVNIDKFLTSLIRDHSWKSPLIVAAISSALLVLLDSFLFALAIELVKLLLLVLVIAMLSYSAWLAYPILKKKYEEKSKETDTEKKS